MIALPEMKIYEVKTMKKIDIRIIITVIICITILEAYAISKGINGLLLSTVLVIFAALAGLSLPTPKIMQR